MRSSERCSRDSRRGAKTRRVEDGTGGGEGGAKRRAQGRRGRAGGSSRGSHRPERETRGAPRDGSGERRGDERRRRGDERRRRGDERRRRRRRKMNHPPRVWVSREGRTESRVVFHTRAIVAHARVMGVMEMHGRRRDDRVGADDANLGHRDESRRLRLNSRDRPASSPFVASVSGSGTMMLASAGSRTPRFQARAHVHLASARGRRSVSPRATVRVPSCATDGGREPSSAQTLRLQSMGQNSSLGNAPST